MATCSDIIARALRMARIVAIGDNPTASEEDEGMTVLNGIYLRLAHTALATAEEVYETADYEAQEGESVYCTGTVTLPSLIDECRRPADLAAIRYQDETTSSAWRYYVSDRGTWTRIDNLTEASTAPFADRNQEGLSALVAVELAETFGKEVGASTLQKARRFQSMMQPVDTAPNEYY